MAAVRTFTQFCQELRCTESEATELVYVLAAMRMRQTLRLLAHIKPDKTAAILIDEQKRS